MSDDSLDSKAPRAAKPQAAAKGPREGGKPELRGRWMTGRIGRIIRGQGHGFIRAEDGREVFFHRSEVPASFNNIAVDDHVASEVIEDHVT